MGSYCTTWILSEYKCGELWSHWQGVDKCSVRSAGIALVFYKERTRATTRRTRVIWTLHSRQDYHGVSTIGLRNIS